MSEVIVNPISGKSVYLKDYEKLNRNIDKYNKDPDHNKKIAYHYEPDGTLKSIKTGKHIETYKYKKGSINTLVKRSSDSESSESEESEEEHKKIGPVIKMGPKIPQNIPKMIKGPIQNNQQSMIPKLNKHQTSTNISSDEDSEEPEEQDKNIKLISAEEFKRLTPEKALLYLQNNIAPSILINCIKSGITNTNDKINIEKEIKMIMNPESVFSTKEHTKEKSPKHSKSKSESESDSEESDIESFGTKEVKLIRRSRRKTDPNHRKFRKSIKKYKF